MHTIAFKMQLHKGFEAEYKRRHDKLWPELRQLLKSNGISEYHIFLDETTNNLFGVLKAADTGLIKNLAYTSCNAKMVVLHEGYYGM